MLDVVIGKIRFSDYHLCLTERPEIPVAEEDVTFHDVSGRDGSLTEKGNLKDRKIKLQVNRLEETPAKSELRRFRGSLLALVNAQLIFSDEPEFCYIVKHIKMGDIANEIAEKGEFDLELTLDPFDYSVETKRYEGTSRVDIVNEGTYKALPIITVSGNGDIVVKVNGQAITITGVIGKIVLDCDKLDYYHPDKETVRDFKVHARDFPILDIGRNRVTTTGNVTQLIVEFKERYR